MLNVRWLITLMYCCRGLKHNNKNRNENYIMSEVNYGSHTRSVALLRLTGMQQLFAIFKQRIPFPKILKQDEMSKKPNSFKLTKLNSRMMILNKILRRKQCFTNIY
jgi:hypothetical protein